MLLGQHGSRYDLLEMSRLSKTLKSNFAQVETFFYFPTKADVCMTNFTMDKSKTDKSNFG